MRLLAVILMVAGTLSARADVLVTRSVIHTGEIVRVDADSVEMKVAGAEITIPKSDILKLDQGDPAKAAESVQAFLKPMLAKSFLTDEQGATVAEALVLLGDSQLATGKTNDALDSYLKVVALFDVDADRAADAKYKAAKVFEQSGHWKRAKQSYG
jgi:hypothetical protein